MTAIPLNGGQLRVRLVEVEISKLKLDPENPRLHSSYLTHDLPAKPTQTQLTDALERLPEFQSLIDALIRNNGCFQPPLVTVDYRVLEGNRRVAALRKLRAERGRGRQWQTLTIEQLIDRVPPEKEKALRSKYHLEHALSWDGLSQLTEYVAVADREGTDYLATMLGRFPPQIEPLLVAGRCLKRFSEAYPEVRSQELLWVLAGLCGVKQVEPQVAFSRTTRCIYTDNDEERPAKQVFPLDQIMKWLAEGRFTNPYQDDDREYTVKPGRPPLLFRQARLAGEEVFSHFLETGGSLAKAVSFIDGGYSEQYRKQRRSLLQTQKFLDLVNQMEPVRREENPDLYRETLACYHRLGQLLGLERKEKRRVHAR
jgi:hypothetical protein